MQDTLIIRALERTAVQGRLHHSMYCLHDVQSEVNGPQQTCVGKHEHIYELH